MPIQLTSTVHTATGGLGVMRGEALMSKSGHYGAPALLRTRMPGFGLKALLGMDAVFPAGSSSILNRQLNLWSVNFYNCLRH